MSGSSSGSMSIDRTTRAPIFSGASLSTHRETESIRLRTGTRNAVIATTGCSLWGIGPGNLLESRVLMVRAFLPIALRMRISRPPASTPRIRISWDQTWAEQQISPWNPIVGIWYVQRRNRHRFPQRQTRACSRERAELRPAMQLVCHLGLQSRLERTERLSLPPPSPVVGILVGRYLRDTPSSSASSGFIRTYR
jgi:hypothetical protein